MTDSNQGEALPSPTKTELMGVAKEYLFRYSHHDFIDIVVSRAQGSRVYDRDGRSVLDFSSGQMCSTIGHNHPAILKAIDASKDQPIHLYTYMLDESVIGLARKLGELLPNELRKIMFLSTGGESNEAAIRMAKMHTGGFEVISVDASWHGMTAGAHSSTFGGGRKGYGPMMSGTFALPLPNSFRCPIQHCRDVCDKTCLKVGFGMIDTMSTGSYAALITEPLFGAGGLTVPPEGYFNFLRQECDKRNMLLIVDEAQTGLGRSGVMFTHERTGIVPDILTLSKTLGGGFALSATCTSSEIEEDVHEKGFIYHTSHTSDPMPARIGLAVIDVIVREELAKRAQELGKYFMERLDTLKQKYDFVADVRGMGLLIGVELVKDRKTRDTYPELGHYLVDKCFGSGLHFHLSGMASASKVGTVIKLAPPMTVTEAEIDEAVSILDKAMSQWRSS